jgi:hypothetical protein
MSTLLLSKVPPGIAGATMAAAADITKAVSAQISHVKLGPPEKLRYFRANYVLLAEIGLASYDSAQVFRRKGKTMSPAARLISKPLRRSRDHFGARVERINDPLAGLERVHT